MLSSPTAMGITGFTGLPSATHFSISPATCQGQAAVAVAAFAGILWRRPQAPEIICASHFARLQKILNTTERFFRPLRYLQYIDICILSFSPYHLIHYTSIALNDLYNLCTDIIFTVAIHDSG